MITKVSLFFVFIFSFILIRASYIFASEYTPADKYEVSIIEKLIIDSIKKEKPYVFIYSDNKQKKIRFKRKLKDLSKNLRITSKLYKADFVIVLDLKSRKYLKKPSLALDFISLRNCLSCIGIFSWRNGRPALILFKKRLDKYMLKLPEEYSYFIE